MITKQLESGGNNLTEAKMAKMREGLTKLDLLQQNIVPLMIVSVIGLGLCLFGAIMMRKLKKMDFGFTWQDKLFRLQAASLLWAVHSLLI